MAIAKSYEQSGSIEFMYLLLMLLPTTLILLHLYLVSTHYRELKHHLSQTLCLKEQLIDLKNLVRKINSINKIIKTGDSLEKLSWFLPTSMLGKLNIKKLKKALQHYQNLIFNRYRLDLISKRSKGCELPLAFIQTPYHHQGMLLIRDQDGVTLTRQSTTHFSWKTALYHYRFSTEIKSALTPDITMSSL